MKRILFGLTVALLAGLNWQCGKRNEVPLGIGPPVLPEKQLQAAFLVVDGVYNSELMAPMDVLQHTVFQTPKGIRVFTVAPYDSVITTFEGLHLIPDYAFASDSLPTIDILIVPSARHSMDDDLMNTRLISFVEKTGREASYVMSLCDGAFVLAKAGLLDLHECTTFPGDIDRFKAAFPQLKVHADVIFVHDRKLITSAGGARSYDPALYLVELLYGQNVAKSIAKGLVLDWNAATVPAVIRP
jgi:transcriptional regulator GlxA family with amidase domain